MNHGRPFAAWPEEVAFRARELNVILGALEHAFAELAADTAARRSVRRAQLLIWRRLWPELADQYEEPNDEVEE